MSFSAYLTNDRKLSAQVIQISNAIEKILAPNFFYQHYHEQLDEEARGSMRAKFRKASSCKQGFAKVNTSTHFRGRSEGKSNSAGVSSRLCVSAQGGVTMFILIPGALRQKKKSLGKWMGRESDSVDGMREKRRCSEVKPHQVHDASSQPYMKSKRRE